MTNAMLGSKKWTIGYVNFHTFTYIKWQLKILYEFNDFRDFNLVIVDNSVPHENQQLESLREEYSRFDNIKIIYNDELMPDAKGSAHHALGLEIVLAHANSEYLLVQDPDFFWVKKGYLSIFSAYLDEGYVAVGAPYRRPVGIGSENFPTAFGFACRVRDLDKGDFLTETDSVNIEKLNYSYPHPQYEGSWDVGFRIRMKLSNFPFISFTQRDICELSKIAGEHSFEILPCEYFLDNEPVAFHLFRGSFPCHVDKMKVGSNLRPPKNWVDVREKYARTFYELACSGLRRKIFNVRLHLTRYRYYIELLPLKHSLIYMQNYNYQNRDIALIRAFIFMELDNIKRRVNTATRILNFYRVEFANADIDLSLLQAAKLIYSGRNLWTIARYAPRLVLKNKATYEEINAVTLYQDIQSLRCNLDKLIASLHCYQKDFHSGKSYYQRKFFPFWLKVNAQLHVKLMSFKFFIRIFFDLSFSHFDQRVHENSSVID